MQESLGPIFAGLPSAAWHFGALGQTLPVPAGCAAVELAADFNPEVVLLDIGLPLMNGYEVARRLRQEEGGEKLILVALSGYAQDHDRGKSREAGFDHHLVKPGDLETLSDLLDHVDTPRD